MTFVLNQEWGDQNKPVGYCSQQLDTVQVVYLALQCASPVVLDLKITIRCPHSEHVTLPRWIKLSTAKKIPNITIEKSTPLNPATLLESSGYR